MLGDKKAFSEAKSYGMSFFERAIQRYVMPGVVVATAGAASASSVPHGASR